MARQGGIGIIHKNMTIEAQADEVDKVKTFRERRYHRSVLSVTGAHAGRCQRLMAKFRISGVPITENGKLVGIITNP